MKALLLDNPGPPNRLRLADIDQPEPALGEVRIQVQAVGLNPIDYKLAAKGHPTWHYPFVLGVDVAGVVDAVGPQVAGWQVGQRVVYHGDLSRFGGFAEYTLTKAHVMTSVPQSVSFIEAAALPCAGYTAYQALFRKLHLRERQTILVQGGAGGVGGFAVQLAAQAKATILTTCSDYNMEYVQELGADYAIDYRNESVKKRVLDITNGRGVDVIIDTVSGESATEGIAMLAFGGGMACVAGMVDCTKVQSWAKTISIHKMALGAAHLSSDLLAQKDLARIGGELMDLLHARRIDPMVNEIISLAEIPAALERLAERHVRGKIVAEIRA